MDSFLLAVQFLTILPIKIKEAGDKKIAHSIIYFPFVGLLLGLLLWGINAGLLILNFSLLENNIILVISLIIFTGGLHLDGLADTADAILSGKPKEEMLLIMRDPHIGVMGVLALISVILLKIAFLSSINTPMKFASLVLMCTLSRWSQVFAIFSFPYARRDGKAKIFKEGISLKIFILATLITFVCAFFTWQLKGLLVFAIIAISGYIFGKFINKKIGGMTGDTLGAISELTEVVILISICILERSLL